MNAFARPIVWSLRFRFVRRFLGNRVIGVDYPVVPSVRWDDRGNGHVERLIEARAGQVSSALEKIRGVLPFVDSTELPWDNEWCPPLDGLAIVAAIVSRRPKTYFEIGSGYSTLFAAHAIKALGLGTKIVSVDPRPRADVDRVCDTVIRLSFEAVSVDEYPRLEPGDVVFVDSSHLALQNSDVTAVFLDLLPAVPDGVAIGFHDIFLPFDYGQKWSNRFYNEQYIFAAYLLGLGRRAEIDLPVYYLIRSPKFSDEMRPIVDFLKRRDAAVNGGSFWITKSSG